MEERRSSGGVADGEDGLDGGKGLVIRWWERGWKSGVGWGGMGLGDV